MRVIALHGDFANGRVFRRDTGIEEWEYPDWEFGPIEVYTPIVLVGYSRGGSEVGNLSHGLHDLIAGAVLYESPLLGIDEVAGNFPVLWIENDRGRRSRGGRFEREMQATLEAWMAGGRSVDTLWGRGRHVEPTFGWPPCRHGWDRSLNGKILDWISRL